MNPMRRLTALAMVAMLAVALTLAVMGCGAKQEEPAATPPASEAMPPAEHMMSDSTMMADTSMAH
jgi:hypothetical protein